MSVVKVYCKIETSPWALTLTEAVPEAFELSATDWPQKMFLWPVSEDEQPGDSDVFLHGVVFLIDRHSCVAHSSGKVSPSVSIQLEYSIHLARVLNIVAILIVPRSGI